jgi:hypothetical protein
VVSTASRPAIALAVVAVIASAAVACGGDGDAVESERTDGEPSSSVTTQPGTATPSRGPFDPTHQPTREPTRQPTRDPESPATPTRDRDIPTPTEEPMPEDGPLAAAISDLARETGVDPDDIGVVAHDPVTWRDGSLGCPEPGKMYTQALVDGYRIVLRVDGKDVTYHGATGRPPFRCDHPNPNGAI